MEREKLVIEYIDLAFEYSNVLMCHTAKPEEHEEMCVKKPIIWERMQEIRKCLDMPLMPERDASL